MMPFTKNAFRLFLVAFFLFVAADTRAAVLPKSFYEYLVVDGFPGPTTMAFSPDGRLFVGQQTGELRVIKNGKLVETPVLTVEVDSLGEHGLLGITFDPNFSDNHYLYIYYTAKQPRMHNRLSRFVLNGDIATDEAVLFDFDDVGHSIFHNGAQIKFGPDGKLYVGPGENGGVPFLDNAQQLSNMFGKIVRLNPDGSIPEDNPFYEELSGKERAIYAYGLRNPYSFDFEPGTNRLFVNDIGAEKVEEINVIEAGKNYGWPLAEGKSEIAGLVNPFYSYNHGAITSLDNGCAITGGVFYHPTRKNFPKQYANKYFFTDYCNSWINILDTKTGEVSHFGQRIAANPTILVLGPDGAIYYGSRWMEGIYKIAYSGDEQ